MKLYRVTLKGFDNSHYKVSYVVAENCQDAYDQVKNFLDGKDLGFSGERELDKVELIAENLVYTDTGAILYIAPNVMRVDNEAKK